MSPYFFAVYLDEPARLSKRGCTVGNRQWFAWAIFVQSQSHAFRVRVI